MIGLKLQRHQENFYHFCKFSGPIYLTCLQLIDKRLIILKARRQQVRFESFHLQHSHAPAADGASRPGAFAKTPPAGDPVRWPAPHRPARGAIQSAAPAPARFPAPCPTATIPPPRQCAGAGCRRAENSGPANGSVGCRPWRGLVSFRRASWVGRAQLGGEDLNRPTQWRLSDGQRRGEADDVRVLALGEQDEAAMQHGFDDAQGKFRRGRTIGPA